MKIFNRIMWFVCMVLSGVFCFKSDGEAGIFFVVMALHFKIDSNEK